MADSRIVKEYTYESVLSKPIYDFVAQKRGSGFLYNSEAKMLKRFDKYVSDTGQTTCEISRKLFDDYTAKTEYDSERNHQSRYSLIRMFAKFMKSQRYDAYVPNYGSFSQKSKFVPYIFTEDELNRLFSAADSYVRPTHIDRNSKIDLIIPVIFKMLYGGGFRISELTHLKLSDVDFDNRIVKVVHSKFQCERLVPLSKSLMTLLKDYSDKVHLGMPKDSIFFPTPKGDVYAESNIYQRFRDLLWEAGISHGGRGNGPRLHDLRHTFAVHRLKYWARTEINVSDMLALLSAYMGHKKLTATEKYLRLTFDAFPDVNSALEKSYGSLIPELAATGGAL